MLLSLFYPPACLHCHEETFELLCKQCLAEMTLIHPRERCPHCFSPDYAEKLCSLCVTWPLHLDKAAAAFERMGPPSTLVNQFSRGSRPDLAKGLGAYMTAQLMQLEWPLQDIIAPLPITFSRWFYRGYNPNLLLAEIISKILERPLLQYNDRLDDKRVLIITTELAAEPLATFTMTLRRMGAAHVAALSALD